MASLCAVFLRPVTVTKIHVFISSATFNCQRTHRQPVPGAVISELSEAKERATVCIESEQYGFLGGAEAKAGQVR